MAKVCCVCNEVKEASENRLFSCGGQGCGITVHQACYGIVTIPPGHWFCRKCESQERAARVKCELCPKKDGALKRTDSTGSGGWAHVVCALYIPEVTFGNLRTMEPIVTSKLPRERFAKVCYICEKVGLETQATVGACMSCHKSNCRMAFHVTCAQKERLLVEEEDPRDPRNIIYCGYCANHYKKMMRQKMKQSLRKQHTPGPSATSMSAGEPPLPPGSVAITSHPLDPERPRQPDHSSSTNSLSKPASLHKQQQQQQVPKMKDGDRILKRPSSETLLPPVKRKYRRRKLSSSNESSTSEAASNSSEVLARDATQPISPVGPFSSDSSISRREEIHQHNSLDNLDLLASVTQKMDTHLPSGGGRGSLPVSPNSVSSEGIIRHVEPPERGRKRKSSTAHSSTGPPTAVAVTAISGTAGSNVPPKSLQELLEKQWEQTAQFIIDQAGRRNNAGSMLAHLHELQSENRKMKARIMELASQREFFIATNAHLQQSLSETSINKVINGIQLLSDNAPLNSRGSWVEQPHAGQNSNMEVDSNDTANHHGEVSSADTSRSWSVHIPSTVNAVTRVTNSVQGPISTFPPFPSIPGLNDTSSSSHS